MSYIESLDVDDPVAFAARVIGDSMLPEYREGDVVIFSPAATIEDGCDCIIEAEPDIGPTFRRVTLEKRRGKPFIVLHALNPTSGAPTAIARGKVLTICRAIRIMRAAPGLEHVSTNPHNLPAARKEARAEKPAQASSS